MNNEGQMKLVYIASPYAGDIEYNTGMAREYCRYATEQGVVPVGVHLLFPQFMDEHNPAERAWACEMGLEVLARCDEVWVFGSHISSGMAAEIAEAERLGMDIQYIHSIEALQEPESMEAPASGMSISL